MSKGKTDSTCVSSWVRMIKNFTQRALKPARRRAIASAEIAPLFERQLPRKAIRIFCVAPDGNLLGTMSAPANEKKSNSSTLESYVTQLKNEI